MLDLPRLNRIRLTSRPLGQRLVARGFLAPNYRLGQLKILFENEHRLPSEPVVFAMNHTDRYNYWPFQYRLCRELDRYTATWVKGKYYENRFIGAFMENTNNLPTVSRGYITAKDFSQVMQRRPSTEEYTAIRNAVNAVAAGEAPDLQNIPAKLLGTRRNMLGRQFNPANETHPDAICRLFAKMMARFVALNEEVFDKGLDLLVFPQGTRSIRLTKGHIGMMQVAMKYKRTIVPIGCSGSDHAYPGSSPVAKPATIVYRFGEPIPYSELAAHAPDESFEPFLFEDETKYRQNFQKATDVVMERINQLVDPPYQFGDANDVLVSGSQRFI